MTREIRPAPYADSKEREAAEGHNMLGAEVKIMSSILTEQFFFMPPPVGVSGYAHQGLLYRCPFPQIPEKGASWRDGKEPHWQTHLEAVADTELAQVYRQMFDGTIARSPEDQAEFLRNRSAWLEAQAIHQLAERYRIAGKPEVSDPVGKAAFDLFNEGRWAYRDRILAEEGDNYIKALKKGNFPTMAQKLARNFLTHTAKKHVLKLGAKAAEAVIGLPIAGALEVYHLTQMIRENAPKVGYHLRKLGKPKVVFDAAAETPERRWVTVSDDETKFHEAYKNLVDILAARNEQLEYTYRGQDGKLYAVEFPMEYNLEKTDALMTALFLHQGTREAVRQYTAGVFLRYAGKYVPMFLQMQFKLMKQQRH